MFLLIWVLFFTQPLVFNISIHLMFLLIKMITAASRCYCNFNTSHVSINRFRRRKQVDAIHISIHLMFLLIRVSGAITQYALLISIHLMFLLIDHDPVPSWDNRKISIHLMFLLINNPVPGLSPLVPDFNTSHVSINLRKTVRAALLCLFQYISCFY